MAPLGPLVEVKVATEVEAQALVEGEARVLAAAQALADPVQVAPARAGQALAVLVRAGVGRRLAPAVRVALSAAALTVVDQAPAGEPELADLVIRVVRGHALAGHEEILAARVAGHVPVLVDH